MEKCKICGGRIVFSAMNTHICTNCGLESNVLLMSHITPRDWQTEQLCNIYSRRKRFKGLLDLLFFPNPSTKDNKMMRYLDNRGPFDDQEALVVSIKKSRLPEKRYCNLHLFAKLFTKDYTPPVLPLDIAHRTTLILRQFDDVEFAFTRLFCGIQFINYRWLLGEILIDHKLSQYLVFVKTLKCKNRVEYYTDMLQKINTYINASSRFHPSSQVRVD